MFEGLIQQDEQLLIFLQNLGSVHWDLFWNILTHKYLTALFYISILFVVLKKTTWKYALLVLFLGVLLITVSDQLANVFKYGFQRLRPCNDPVVSLFLRKMGYCNGGYSFFSAHASTGMGLALYFGLVLKPFFKKALLLTLSFGFFVGYSRIYIGVHYPIDVLVGFFIGLLIALSMFRLLRYLSKRYNFIFF